jgi:hypothetical protein
MINRNVILSVICITFTEIAHAEKTYVSLCTPDENIYFSCKVKKNHVSVCGSKNSPKDSGYVFYRFGMLGKIPELVYPKNKTKPSEAFVLHINYDKTATWYSHELSFKVGDISYIVYENNGNSHSVGTNGVYVVRGENTIADFPCNQDDGGRITRLEEIDYYYEFPN